MRYSNEFHLNNIDHCIYCKESWSQPISRYSTCLTNVFCKVYANIFIKLNKNIMNSKQNVHLVVNLCPKQNQ